MRRALVGMLTTFVVLVLVCEATAATRVALVIGNGSYAEAPLRNPGNDARLMAESLRELGFDVVEHLDADQRAMKRAIQDFGQRLEEAGKETVGLFYYAGHGVQAKGANFLIPVDAAITREADLEIEAVEARWVLTQMEFAGNRMNMVILDACRNNPYRASFRSATRGLARMEAPKGSLIAYATAPGEVALDGVGLNGPYTETLAAAMHRPGVGVLEMFNDVGLEVAELTNSRQQPWVSSSPLPGDFTFAPRDPLAATAPPKQPFEDELVVASAPRAGQAPPEFDDRALELAFWETINDSGNPADFEDYLARYPAGTFSGIAERKLRSLDRRGSPPVEPIEVLTSLALAPPEVALPRVDPVALPRVDPVALPRVYPVAPPRVDPVAPRVDPVEGDYFALKPSDVRAAPTNASTMVGMVRQGEPVEVLGEVRGRHWYLLGRKGEWFGYIYGDSIAQLGVAAVASAQPTGPPPSVRPKGVRIFNVLPVVYQGRRLDQLTAVINQALAAVPASTVISEPDEIAPEDTVVSLLITRLDQRVVPNPAYGGAQMARRIFGSLGQMITQNVPSHLAAYTAHVAVTAKNPEVVTEDGLIELTEDVRQAGDRLADEALRQATEEAVGRLVIRLTGGVPPPRSR